MPQWLALLTGRILGWIWFHLIPIRRKVALANLEFVFPNLERATRMRIGALAFRNMATGAVEMLRAPSLNQALASQMFEIEGRRHLDEALEKQKGVIVASAHFGNFDLAACAMATLGVELCAVTRQQSQKGVNRFWMEVRQRCGVTLIPAKSSAWKISRALRSGSVVILVIDQHMPPGRGIPVDFFGKPASTINAPAVISQATGAPIVPALVSRLPHGRHKLVFEPAIELQPGIDRKEQVEQVTRRLNQWLEDRIKQNPAQWIWVHRRWKVTEPRN